MDTPSLSTDKPKAKPGPKAKPKVDVEALEKQVEALTALVIEMGTHTGQANIIRKHKFPAFQHIPRSKYG